MQLNSNPLKGILLDVTYEDINEESIIKLFLTNEKERFWVYDFDFHPYFYVSCEKNSIEKKKDFLEKFVFGEEEKFRVLKVEETKLSVEKNPVLKVFFKKVSELVIARNHTREMGFEKYEYDIPYGKRYLIDKNLAPCGWIEIECEEQEGKQVIKKITPLEGEFDCEFKAFDLETWVGKKFEIGAEPIVFTSFVSNKKKKGKGNTRVISYNTAQIKGLELLEDEKELISEIQKELNDCDCIVTYNGDNFDFAYTKIRAKKNNLEFKINENEVKIARSGLDNAAKISGIQHIDAYQIMQFLQRTGSVNTVKLDIETVSEKVFGIKKEKVYPLEINEAYSSKDEEKVERVVDYNLKDSQTALRIVEEFLPLFVEVSKLTSQTLYDTTRETTSQMVEDLLLKEGHERGIIAPNKPREDAVKQRTTNPIKGAFVKEPIAGLHENIAVLDFASLYPSIIISHNISPETLNCEHAECKEKNSNSDGTHFCLKEKGMFPEILGKMLKKRLEFKREYKEKKKKGIEDKSLFAKQWALKIILNSVYGYLAYPRARYYSRECASATTALAREYIQETIKKAEHEGFEVLYGDSITKDRYVTVLNPKGEIEVINIEELYEKSEGFLTMRNGKEARIIEGYKALSLNKKTLTPEWSEIKEIIRHKSNKKIYRVHQKYGETICTQDHSIITLGENNTLEETKPIKMNDKKFITIDQIPKSKEIKRIDLFELVKEYKYPRRYKESNFFSQWHIEDEYIWFGFFDIEKQVMIKRFIDTDSCEFESLCRLLGAYIAEGSSSTIETTSTRNGASISSSNTNWLKELQKDYHTLFINTKTNIIKSTKKIRTLTYGKDKKTITYEDKTCKLQMLNETAAVFFKQLCGQKSYGKKLPNFIFNVSDRYKEILLEKMIEGDGTHAVNKKLGYTKEYIEKNFAYTTNSTGVISGLSLLLRQLGRNYSIQYRESKKAYTLKTCDKNKEQYKTKIIPEEYTGFVYDLSVKENNNFVDSCGQVLLHNTDSNFLKMLDKSKKDVETFVEKINKELPETMELEFDGFYKRGIFVTKKEGVAAKKRYALIDEKGNLKIVGFEYVRRDWCNIAKETQKRVIEMVLSEGKTKEPVEYVRKVIKDLKEGKTPKSELVVMTLLQRKPKDYTSIGPHVAAVIKAESRGKKIDVGSMLSFIITKPKKGKESISEKAELEEYVNEGDYDAEYYIENQVIPAVIKIMQELGYTKEDLIAGGKQSGLNQWC